jgi:Sigma-70, region 4
MPEKCVVESCENEAAKVVVPIRADLAALCWKHRSNARSLLRLNPNRPGEPVSWLTDHRARPRFGITYSQQMKRDERVELFAEGKEYPRHQRPRRYSECVKAGLGTAKRPCPFAGCVHHTFLDVDPRSGSLHIAYPDLQPNEMKHTCTLRLAERDGMTLEEIGAVMGLTRERCRQIEEKALLKIRKVSQVLATLR